MAIGFLALSLISLAAGQIFQKRAALRYVAAPWSPGDRLRTLPLGDLLAAALCLIAGTIAWLFVLYGMEVSRAVPILSLGSILVLAASRFHLKERVSPQRWLGALLIAFGVALVSAS